jgi:hypothetical protein
MKRLLIFSIFILNLAASHMPVVDIKDDQKLLNAASNLSIKDFADAVSTTKNLASQDGMKNNFLHRLAMRNDNKETFLAGVRFCVSKNYHELLVQNNSCGSLPLDIALQRSPLLKDYIEQGFYSAILHPSDKHFDHPDKYFWSRLIAVSAMHDVQQKKVLRAKPY